MIQFFVGLIILNLTFVIGQTGNSTLTTPVTDNPPTDFVLTVVGCGILIGLLIVLIFKIYNSTKTRRHRQSVLPIHEAKPNTIENDDDFTLSE